MFNPKCPVAHMADPEKNPAPGGDPHDMDNDIVDPPAGDAIIDPNDDLSLVNHPDPEADGILDRVEAELMDAHGDELAPLRNDNGVPSAAPHHSQVEQDPQRL